MEDSYRRQVGLQETASGIYAYIGEDGVANAGFAVGERGVLMIDSGMSPAQGEELLQAVRRVTDKPIRILINTHYHGDHVLGNEVFSPPALILSHRKTWSTLKKLGSQYVEAFASRRPPNLADEVRKARLILPEVLIDSSLSLDMKGLRADVHYYGEAHTEGDLVVYFPDQGVLFGGDLVLNRVVPPVLGGSLLGWIETLETISSLKITSIVPGHGPIGGDTLIAESKGYLTELLGAIRLARSEGKDLMGAIAGFNKEPYAGWRGVERIEEGLRIAWEQLSS